MLLTLRERSRIALRPLIADSGWTGFWRSGMPFLNTTRYRLSAQCSSRSCSCSKLPVLCLLDNHPHADWRPTPLAVGRLGCFLARGTVVCSNDGSMAKSLRPARCLVCRLVSSLAARCPRRKRVHIVPTRCSCRAMRNV